MEAFKKTELILAGIAKRLDAKYDPTTSDQMVAWERAGATKQTLGYLVACLTSDDKNDREKARSEVRALVQLAQDSGNKPAQQ